MGVGIQSDHLRGSRPAGRTSARTLWIVWVCAAAACLSPGCGKKPATPSGASPQGTPIEKTAERGPVHVVVRAEKGEISIAEKVNLTIEVTAADGVDIKMPEFGDKLNEFQIRDFSDRSAVPGKGSRHWEQRYLLDIYLSGDYSIPAITVKFTDRRNATGPTTADQAGTQPAPGVIEGEVQTEPLTIKVTSLLEGQFDPAKFHDIKGPVELPVRRGRAWMWWTGGGVAALLLLVGAIWWIRRRRARIPRAKMVPPDVWARRQLQELAAEQLVERGRVHEFYYRLTYILRRYIEWRFSINATEQTTGEFLAEVGHHPALAGRYRDLLATFLSAADLVKFARYQPQPSEIEQAAGAANDFVDATANTGAGAAGGAAA